MRNKITEFIKAYDHDVQEMFDELDIELEDVIDILIRGGHVVLPDWLNGVELLWSEDDVEVEEIEQ